MLEHLIRPQEYTIINLKAALFIYGSVVYLQRILLGSPF
jgi:hypothetical protein